MTLCHHFCAGSIIRTNVIQFLNFGEIQISSKKCFIASTAAIKPGERNKQNLDWKRGRVENLVRNKFRRKLREERLAKTVQRERENIKRPFIGATSQSHLDMLYRELSLIYLDLIPAKFNRCKQIQMNLILPKIKALFQLLWGETQVQKAVGSNPSTAYWMDIFLIYLL